MPIFELRKILKPPLNIRYANACITLRDNEHFLNAAEWLKSNLEKRKAMQTSLESPSGRKSRTPRLAKKSPTKQHEASDGRGEEYPGDVPTLTLTESQQGVDETYEYVGISRIE